MEMERFDAKVALILAPGIMKFIAHTVYMRHKVALSTVLASNRLLCMTEREIPPRLPRKELPYLLSFRVQRELGEKTKRKNLTVAPFVSQEYVHPAETEKLAD